MNILALETSCDETAAAIVSESGEILSNIVASQVKDHKAFGGVVPEIASRRHVELIQPVTEQALLQAGLTLKDMGGIAVTQGPGLVGALLVGISYAKALAYGLDIPVCGINHLEGHLSAARIENEITYPHIGMVVSGGHTSIFRVDSISHMSLIGRTLDDAAGEAFDKVAKLLGLGYPGGVIIDTISKDIDHLHIDLPRPMIRDKSLDFSFSGLKTAVLNLVIKKHIFPDIDLKFSGMQEKREPYPDKKHLIAEIAAAFQAAVVDVLVSKALDAVQANNMDMLVVAGGVACNSSLRQTIQDKTTEAGIRLCIPAQKYCGDNAAMIGMASIRYFQHGLTADLKMNAVSRFEIY